MSFLGDVLSSVAKGALEGVLESVAEATGNVSVTWYCDNCNAIMNNQEGFTTRHGYWECTACGTANDVSDDNVYRSEREYDAYRAKPRCPYCGKLLDTEDGVYFTCSGEWCMNERFTIENGKVVDARSYTRTLFSNERTCQYCGETSRGWEYVAAWENGNNPNGYRKCPKCGQAEFEDYD